MIKIQVGDKEYNVKEAKTEEEKKKGLQGIKELPENEGMLFYYDPPQEVSFWMKDVEIPLDIIFFNDDQEVTGIYNGKPNDRNTITSKNVAFVLEINENSDINIGDELEFDSDDKPVMKVLAQDGTSQMDLWGGERIISRRETKILIKKAKKALLSGEDSDYKALGNYIFKVIKKQDNREPEYVQSPN